MIERRRECTDLGLDLGEREEQVVSLGESQEQEQIEELVDGQNPGPEAPPRSKKKQE